MSHDLQEEKKVVASNEGKARDLQVKINAIQAIEKVRLTEMSVKGCSC
jgi:hypothetical protein